MAVARARFVLASSIMLGSLGLLIAGSAAAALAVKRPLVPAGTNLRFQIGGELQIPIAQTRLGHTTFGKQTNILADPECVPRGGIKGINPIPGAQITTFDTGRLRILTSRFTLRGKYSNRQSGHPYTAKVIGVKTQNPVALQVVTYFKIQIPKPSTMVTMTGGKTRGLYVHATAAPAKARKNGGMSGRTGPDVVAWCPGQTAIVTGMTKYGATVPGANPGCANPLGAGMSVTIASCPTSQAGPCPGTGTQMEFIRGYMKYTRTGKMLGGPANGTLRGPADVVIGATGVGVFAIPLNIGTDPKLKVADPAIGGSFGQFFQQNAGMGSKFPVPISKLNDYFNDCGVLQKKLPAATQPKAQSNRTTASFGGPLTQGTLTISAATNTGFEMYVLKGYDNRTPTKFGLGKGAGKIRLVTGSISKRQLTGSNVNHGVLTFELPEPGAIAGAAAALLVLLACHRLVNRRS